MQQSGKNLPQTSKAGLDVTSISRNETNPILHLQELHNAGKAVLFKISATAEYSFVRLKLADKTFFLSRAKTIEAACSKIIAKMLANSN